MKVALVCIAKNEDDYLKEWIDYNKALGFDDIFVYQNNWKSKYCDSGIAIFKVINGENMQVATYNSFIAEYHPYYDFAAFFDVDEFLVLKKHANIKEFLANYKNDNAIAINWRTFGDSGLKEVVNDDYSVLNRFIMCGSTLAANCKVIINLKFTKGLVKFVYNPHCTNTLMVDPNRLYAMKKIGCNQQVIKDKVDEIAELFHYRNKTYAEAYKRRMNQQPVCYNGIIKEEFTDKAVFDKTFEDYNKNEITNTLARDFYNSHCIGMSNMQSSQDKVKIAHLPTCIVFAADHRDVNEWTLPFIRITDNSSSAVNIMQDAQLMKYKDILSEVSRIMYVYRNMSSFGGNTFIGFCHYRQFFADTLVEQPLLKTSNKNYLYTVLTPTDQMLRIQRENADGLLSIAFPETGLKNCDLVTWFKALNKVLKYLKIPDGLIDFALQSIHNNIPDKDSLLPFFLAAQKDLFVYHSNIFTVKTQIFIDMMSAFENIFKEVAEHYEKNYEHIAEQFSPRWFGYIFEYLYFNVYFHALELSGKCKFAHCNMLKLV